MTRKRLSRQVRDMSNKPYTSHIIDDLRAIGQSRCTETQDHMTTENFSWICGHAPRGLKLLKHTQYRMVLNIAGYALGRLRGTKELFHASYDAFQGMMILVQDFTIRF